MGGKREHRLRVFTELMFGHMANKPAPGTNDYNRTCMPYPFMGEMSAAEAACDFKIAIDGFKKTAHYSMGESPGRWWAHWSRALVESSRIRKVR